MTSSRIHSIINRISYDRFWRLYYWLSDFRDGLLVHAILKRLKNNAPIIYVHPHGQAGAVAYIARIDVKPAGEEDIDFEDHSHIEGKMR